MLNCIVYVSAHPHDGAGMATALGEFGKVARARSILEATAQINTFAPDVVICEAQVADGTVVDLLAELSQANASAPVIAFAKRPGIPQVVSAIKAGAADFLAYPCQTEDLRAAIAGAVLSAQSGQSKGAATARATGQGAPIPAAVGMNWIEIEEVVIKATLEAVGFSVPAAARMLRLSPSTIYRKMERFR